jgi:hypothetical protein
LDWEILEGLEAVLMVSQYLTRGKYSLQQQVPHKFQQSMSSESTPVLSRTILDFELFMTEWEKLAEEYSILKPWIEIGLRWATKYYIRMDETESYVVAMCKLKSTITALI